MRSSINQSETDANKYGIYFAPSICKVFLQDTVNHVVAPTSCGDLLEAVKTIAYLSTCMSLSLGDEKN